MSGEDLTASRVRRMLPSVSEVLRELTARAPVEPDVAFRAARDVCAEELKRIRDAGGESVPIEVLVERALARVAGVPPPLVVPAPPPFAPAASFEPEPPSLPAGDDPFSETTGALDLRWDREAREPLAAPAAAVPIEAEPPPLLPADEVPVSAPDVEPVDSVAGGPFTVPEEPAGRAPEGGGFVFALPEDEAAPAPPDVPAEPQEEIGDETLTRLSREAEAIDLRSVLAGGGAAAGPPEREEEFGAAATAAVPDAPPGADEPVPPPFEDDEDTVLTIPRGGRRGATREGGPRWGRLAGIAAALAALAALGYLLVGLWIDRGADSGRVAVARQASEKTEAPARESSEREALPVESPTPEPAVPAAPGAEGATAPAPVAVPVPTAPAERPGAVPTVAPALVAPMPVPVKTAPPAPVRQSRDGLVVTRDRAGRPEVFSIHFTSYRDRGAAERDLKRIEALVGREGYVAEVDLGEKGIWFRVMVGEFPSAEEAKGVRAELAAKGTRDMGWVYRVVAP